MMGQFRVAKLSGTTAHLTPMDDAANSMRQRYCPRCTNLIVYLADLTVSKLKIGSEIPINSDHLIPYAYAYFSDIP